VGGKRAAGFQMEGDECNYQKKWVAPVIGNWETPSGGKKTNRSKVQTVGGRRRRSVRNFQYLPNIGGAGYEERKGTTPDSFLQGEQIKTTIPRKKSTTKKTAWLIFMQERGKGADKTLWRETITPIRGKHKVFADGKEGARKDFGTFKDREEEETTTKRGK